MTILTNHGCQIVISQVDDRWTTSLSNRIFHFGDGNSTIDYMGSDAVLFTLVVVYATCLTPHVLPA